MAKITFLATMIAIVCPGCGDDRPDRGPHERGRHRRGRRAEHGPVRVEPDRFERDDDRDRPSRIDIGELQLRTIFPREDEDWIVCRPSRPGAYILEFPYVSVRLDVDVWIARRGRRNDEQEVGSFSVSRPSTFRLRVPPATAVMKMRIRAEDDDERGRYEVVIRRP